MKSQIIIYKRGESYFCDAHGKFGGGYSGAFAGKTPEEAMLFGLREKGRFIDLNPEGGTLVAPVECRETLEDLEVR